MYYVLLYCSVLYWFYLFLVLHTALFYIVRMYRLVHTCMLQFIVTVQLCNIMLSLHKNFMVSKTLGSLQMYNKNQLFVFEVCEKYITNR